MAARVIGGPTQSKGAIHVYENRLPLCHATDHPVLVISLLVALLALALRYAGAHVPYLFPGYIFETLLVAYAVLLAGVVFRKL